MDINRVNWIVIENLIVLTFELCTGFLLVLITRQAWYFVSKLVGVYWYLLVFTGFSERIPDFPAKAGMEALLWPSRYPLVVSLSSSGQVVLAMVGVS